MSRFKFTIEMDVPERLSPSEMVTLITECAIPVSLNPKCREVTILDGIADQVYKCEWCGSYDTMLSKNPHSSSITCHKCGTTLNKGDNV